MLKAKVPECYINVCLSSSTKSPLDNYLCVFVVKLLREVFKRGASRVACVFVHARSSMGMGMCTANVCMPSSPSSRKLLVCVCMYMSVNTPRRLRLHEVVILLLIMKYLISKTVSYSHTTTLCNLINK